ncbi:MAG: glycosyltransferase [Anaeromyxobacter sp.]
MAAEVPTALVVPCFNEASRLDAGGFARLLDLAPALTLWFVDDGSADRTVEVLERAAALRPGRARVLRLERNGGKGEAVRAGLRAALEAGAAVVGYADADLSTPPEELARLAGLAASPRAQVTLGSRVLLLGRHIERRPSRHYLGRVFATFASIALAIPVYDTQCGAKYFRAGPALDRALATPFRTRWVFDVELLARLLHGGGPALRVEDLVEEPLLAWRDAGDSRLSAFAMLRSGLQVIGLAVKLRTGGSPF